MCYEGSVLWTWWKIHWQYHVSDLSQRPIENRDKVLIKLKNGEHKFISVVYYILDIKNYI
jgi:hypothetical protein